uniref:t-SNARE coiled-coil homology domain-containing protein n=1 Tax=Heterorhabditis bacteriophora TaxID=37862 RepID=A0A1I7X3Z9_HETBA
MHFTILCSNRMVTHAQLDDPNEEEELRPLTMDPAIDIALLLERLMNIVQHQNEVLERIHTRVLDTATTVKKMGDKLGAMAHKPRQRMACIFCPVGSNKDHHTSLHCTTYNDVVARASRLINLGLSIKTSLTTRTRSNVKLSVVRVELPIILCYVANTEPVLDTDASVDRQEPTILHFFTSFNMDYSCPF